MSVFNFYADASLTTLLTEEDFTLASDLSFGDVDKVVYFGSPDASMRARNKASPGTAQIMVSVNSSGSGQPTTLVSLATSAGGLSAHNQYANLGTVILGGAGNAVALYIRVNLTGGTYTTGLYNNLSLTFPDGISESAIP